MIDRDKLQMLHKSRRKIYNKINLRHKLKCSPAGQVWMGEITDKTKKAEGSDSISNNSRVNPSVPTKSIYPPEHRLFS